ncbi:MAG: class I SAM-dependent methyltransferase [Candidatus Polarisedimenticolaceae bacterium]|nr:class I SAM-dependent methyltransferase [Candidatus Polarisedimenticolaceae bacterium]
MKIAIKPDLWNEPEQAMQLAARLGLPLATDDESVALLLTYREGRLQIEHTGKPAPGPVLIDFVAGRSAHRRHFGGGRGQPLARALGLKGGKVPTVIDATAGLGRDAFVVATLGCHITLMERSPVIAALLEDGLRRAMDDEDTSEIASRMQLLQGDAAALIAAQPRADVIYLDPMYPESGKKAQVKKEMQLFRQLVGPDLDSEALLAVALKHALKRVVVKRPAKAVALNGPKPSAHISSPNTRYDLYFTSA